MPSRICLFVQRGGRVRFFWGSNGSMSSHSVSVKLLEYGIDSKTAFLFDLNLASEIPNGLYKGIQWRTFRKPDISLSPEK